MKNNERLKTYAKQIGVDTKGAFKNKTTKGRLEAKLTAPQRRRLKKKVSA